MSTANEAEGFDGAALRNSNGGNPEAVLGPAISFLLMQLGARGKIAERVL